MSTYNTKIGEFCATHSNWEELLAEEPYSILVKRKDGFVIFNYRQLSSDFSNDIVRECRGIIFKEGEWDCPVCHAFDKFFNYGEPNCADMDWNSVKVSEKIDGSIMKLWCYDGAWNVSTNGNIDAMDAPVPDIRKDNFKDLFWEGIHKNLDKVRWPGYIIGWLHDLNPSYTYIFEMVSPYTRVVIPYEETDVYFLGARDNISGRQFGCDQASAQLVSCGEFPRPRLYPMQTLTQVTAAASTLPWDVEGYVCYDKNFNRCKIKSPKYVLAHFARNNNVITRKHLIEVILKGEMDEFIIYASDYKESITWMKNLMDSYIKAIDGIGELARSLRKLEKKNAAGVIKNFDKIAQPIMFMNYDRDVSGEEYVAGWNTHKWERAIEQYIKFKER